MRCACGECCARLAPLLQKGKQSKSIESSCFSCRTKFCILCTANRYLPTKIVSREQITNFTWSQFINSTPESCNRRMENNSANILRPTFSRQMSNFVKSHIAQQAIHLLPLPLLDSSARQPSLSLSLLPVVQHSHSHHVP